MITSLSIFLEKNVDVLLLIRCWHKDTLEIVNSSSKCYKAVCSLFSRAMWCNSISCIVRELNHTIVSPPQRYTSPIPQSISSTVKIDFVVPKRVWSVRERVQKWHDGLIHRDDPKALEYECTELAHKHCRLIQSSPIETVWHRDLSSESKVASQGIIR